jgi:cholest-4-en-3-one 26-monooxygenase
MFEWAAMIIGAEDPEYQRGATALDTQRTGNLGIRQYCLDTSLERRGGSGSDLLSVIGNSNVWGRALTDSEVGQNGLMFVVAGLETTRNAISGGTLALIENPDQLRRLRADRSLMRPAVEEILRWTTPLVQAMRTATKDVELGGKQVREGDRVVMCHAAANRDEAAFADPDRFDVGRAPNEHLAFGRGAHYCLGAHLARLEIRLMLEAILDLAPALELAGEVERLRSVIFAGIKHMPVRFSPRHRAAA